MWLSKEGGLAAFPRAVMGAWGAGRLWRKGATRSYDSGMQSVAAAKGTLLPSNVQTKVEASGFEISDREAPQYPTQPQASFLRPEGATFGVYHLVSYTFGQQSKRTVNVEEIRSTAGKDQSIPANLNQCISRACYCLTGDLVFSFPLQTKALTLSRIRLLSGSQQFIRGNHKL